MRIDYRGNAPRGNTNLVCVYGVRRLALLLTRIFLG